MGKSPEARLRLDDCLRVHKVVVARHVALAALQRFFERSLVVRRSPEPRLDAYTRWVTKVGQVYSISSSPPTRRLRLGGRGYNLRFPHILGRDFSGVVAKTGEGVANFAVGNPVC